MNDRSDATDASRLRRRAVFTTIICLLGLALSITLIVTGRASAWTWFLLAGETLGAASGTLRLWTLRGLR